MLVGVCLNLNTKLYDHDLRYKRRSNKHVINCLFFFHDYCLRICLFV